LFDVFDKINKLNGNLFFFGECTKVNHNSKEKVIDLKRDTVIYISVYLRVKFTIISGKDVIFYITKNHEDNIIGAILAAAVTPVLNNTQLIRLNGKLNIKASEDLALYALSTDWNLFYNVLENSVSTTYEAVVGFI